MEQVVSPGETTRSVRRAAQILHLLGASADGCRLTEMARAADLSKATTYRLAQTLVGEGLVDFDEAEGRYAIGTEFVRIALAARTSARLTAIKELEALSGAAMRHLRDRTGETVALVVRRGDDRTNVAVELGTHELIAVPKVGAVLPLHLGGPGKLLIAFMAPDVLEALEKRSKLSLPPARAFNYTRGTQRALNAIREAGYATSFAEAVDGQASIACPVKHGGAPVAALNLIMPTVRFTEAKQASFLPQVRKAAVQISRMLASAHHRHIDDGSET